MARIPHVGGTQATFGQRGPDRPTQFNPDTRGVTAGIDAAGDVARGIGQLALQVQEDDDALARAKASNALLDHELQVRGKTEELAERVQSGDLDWRQAEAEAQTAFDEIQAPAVPGLHPADAERMQGGITRNRAGGAMAIRNAAQQAKRTEFRGQFDTAIDTLGKLAGAPGADIEKINAQAEAFVPLAQQAGVDSAVTAGKIQAFKDRNWTNQATQRLINARDDLDGLNQLERDLTAEDGYYANRLDTEKRNVVLSQVQTAKGRLEARATHLADKREAAASRAITQYEQQTATGLPAPPDTMQKWAATVAGTTYEAEFNDMLKGEAEVQAILNQPPQAQRAYLQQLQARQQREGATVADQGNLKRLSTAVETNLKQLHSEPLVFHANRTGDATAPLDIQALANGDIDAVRGAIADRMVTLETMRRQYGPETGRQPLLPQEATALANALKQATPVSALKLFGSMATAFADPEAYRAAMQQVAPDSPVRALAGMVFAEQRAVTLTPGGLFSGAVKASSGDIAKTLLEGEVILNRTPDAMKEDGKGSAFPMPPPNQLRDEIAVQVGEVFAGRPAAYETALQAVRAYYAGSASRAGDVSGELDTKRVREAVRAVLGEPVDVNDNGEVLPPWGMDEDEFVQKATTAWDSVSKTLPQGVPTEFDNYGLRQAGNGSYFVVGPLGTFVSDKAGNPIQLRVGR